MLEPLPDGGRGPPNGIARLEPAIARLEYGIARLEPAIARLEYGIARLEPATARPEPRSIACRKYLSARAKSLW